jgi:hypothetical protein
MIKPFTRTTLLTATFVVSLGSPALADSAGVPNTHASCIGQEAAGISPKGSSTEFPGGVPQVITELRAAFGSSGPIFAFVAKLHAGSHEACDEATE